MKTQTKFTKDMAGVFHFHCEDDAGEKAIRQAAKEALSEPLPGPAFFWAQGVFCPIIPKDTVDSLYKRWEGFYTEFDNDPASFATKYDEFSQRE